MQKIRNIASAALKSVGMREIFLISGLGLLGYGLSLVFWPAAFGIPGAILVFVAIFGVKGAPTPVHEPKFEEVRNVRAIR
jgi:hypothetical protein